MKTLLKNAVTKVNLSHNYTVIQMRFFHYFASAIFLCLIGFSQLQAQNLFVYDQQSGNPVSDVFIYNDQKTVTGLTNEVGIVNIDKFDHEDNINFQHSSYNAAKFDILTLSKLKYKIGISQKLVDLDEVVVSANKWEADVKEVPNKIEVIKKKDIIFENPQTSADMLESGHQVYVQKSQLAGGSPMLRGFSANRILFVVDGVRMNNAIYRSGNLQNVLQADVNSVENAEVIFGPGTNIYGSDALGGVIDLHTLKPTLSTDERWTANGNAMARLSSADFEKTFHTDVNFGNDKWAFLVSISYSDFDDLVMGSNHNDYTQRFDYVKEINGLDSMVVNDKPNKQLYSGYQQLSFISKVKQQFSKHIDWTLSFYVTQTNNVPRYDRLLQYSGDVLKYAEWYYRPQQWLMNSLEMNFNKRTKMYDHASFRAAYQNVREGRNDRKYQDDWLKKRDESVNIFSFNADFDKSLKWNNFIFYGIEFVYNDVSSKGISENIRTGDTKYASSRYPDSTNKYYLAGGYFSYKKNYTDIPLTLQAGLRFSYVNLRSTFSKEMSEQLSYSTIGINDGALSGSAGLTYRPGRWQLKLNLASGFRAPNLDDMAKIFDSEPGNVVVPNEDLKSEYLYNIDAGFIYNYQGNISVELTGFYSYLVNAMVRRDFQINGQDSIMYDGEMSKVQAIVNAGSATIYGATFIFNAKFLQFLRFNSTLSYIKGTDDEGNALRHAPPLYGASTLSFDRNKLRLGLSAVYNAEITNENLAPSERDSKAYLYATDSNGNAYAPGWWTLDFKGSYKVTEAFLVTFGIENILDYRYRPYSSGITAAGRNFIAAFRFSF